MDKSISQTLAEIREKTSAPKSQEVKYNAQGFEIRKVEPMKEGREEVTLNEHDVFPQINWQDNDKN